MMLRQLHRVFCTAISVFQANLGENQLYFVAELRDSAEDHSPDSMDLPVPSGDHSQQHDSVDLEVAARYGAFSFTYNGCFWIIGGSRDDIEEDSATVLECFSLQHGWQVFKLKGERAPRGWCGIQGAIVDQFLYIFGGWCGDSFNPSKRNNSVRCINLETHVLRTVAPVDQACLPMLKDKYGCIEHEKVLYVFGGYGSRIDPPAKDSDFHRDHHNGSYLGWTNEFHGFDLNTRKWRVVHTTGMKPPPCAAFSFTRIDSQRVLLFGGRQLRQRVNDAYILDLEKWCWQGPFLPSHDHVPWPAPRSFHSTVSLLNPEHIPSGGTARVLVLWGMDQETHPLRDVWTLDVNTMVWEKVTLDDNVGPRVWHTSTALYSPLGHTQVYTFGGSSTSIFLGRGPTYLGHLHIADFGVESLYCAAMLSITANWGVFNKKVNHLPQSLQEDIVQYQKSKRRRKDLKKLCLIK